jgi:two-component system, NarL family, sensor kinase
LKFKISCLLVFIGLSFNVLAQKSAKIEQLEAQIKKAKNKAEKCYLYSRISFEYGEIEPEIAQKYIDSCKVISENLKIDSLTISYLHANGQQLYILTKFDASRIEYQKMANLAEKNKRWENFGFACMGIAGCFQMENKLMPAIKYYNLATNAFEKTNNKIMTIRSTKRKASFLIQSKSYESGIKLLKSCATSFQILKNIEDLANTYGSIGWAYRNYGKNDSAIFYLKKAGVEFNKISNKLMVPIVTTEIGKAYAENKNYNEALKYYKQAENEIAILNIKNYSHADALNNYISQTYIALNRYNEALPYTRKALELAKIGKDDEEQEDANYNMAIVFKNLGYFKESIQKFEIYDSLRFKIEDAKERQNAANAIEKYQGEKKEQQIKLQNAIIDKKNQQLWSIAGFSALLSLLFYLLYNRFIIKQKAKHAAEKANEQFLATQAVLDGEERERKRIAADLHDGVGQTIMALKMNLLGINDYIQFANPKAKEIFDKALDLASESAKEVRSISHQMMPNALIKSGLASAIREFLGNLDTQNIKINLEVNNLQEALDPTIEKVLYRVLQEAVNNVIKHAKATELNIFIDKNTDQIIAKIIDNGQGFDTTKLADGIGMKNIYDRVAFLKGKVNVQSTPKVGTQIQIEIPIA